MIFNPKHIIIKIIAIIVCVCFLWQDIALAGGPDCLRPPQYLQQGKGTRDSNTTANAASQVELFKDGAPIGTELRGEHQRFRDDIEYRLAELGYGLKKDVQIRAVKIPLGQKAIFYNNVLFIDRSATEEATKKATEKHQFTQEFLQKDLSQTLIDDFAGREQEAPAFKITPDYLEHQGIPQTAIDWVCDKYGWYQEQGEWKAGFLPLQTLAIARGICDRDGNLYKSGVIAASTSAGKTLLCELRMLARYFNQDGKPKKTVILVPTREIGKMERLPYLRQAYGAVNKEGGLRICYSDGEERAEDEEIYNGDFDVAIMVNEKFKYFQQNPDFLDDVGEIVFDEIGTMSDEHRGPFLEVAMTGVLHTHKDITILGLTRPASGLQRVFNPMGQKENRFFIQTTKRPVDIQIGIWTAQTRIAEFVNCNTGEASQVEMDLRYPSGRLKETFKELLMHYVKQTEEEIKARQTNNLIIALPTKAMTEQFANILAQLHDEDDEVRQILAQNSHTEGLKDALSNLEPSRRKDLLTRFLPLGIGIHNADLGPQERRLVSDAFRFGDIPILFCTGTLAQGINLPAQTIVFMEWGARPVSSDPEKQKEPYYTSLAPEFVNWLGRVGRFGKKLHRQATALYMCKQRPGSDEYRAIKRIFKGRQEQFTTHLADEETPFEAPVLSAIMCLYNADRQEKPPSLKQIEQIFHLTPSAIDDASRGRISQKIRDTIERLTDVASTVRFIDGADADDGKKAFEVTTYGKIAYSYGVSHEFCEQLYQWLREQAKMYPAAPWDVLDVLSLILKTPDGEESIKPLRVSSRNFKKIKDIFDGYVKKPNNHIDGESGDWSQRSPLVAARNDGLTVNQMATLLAMRDWIDGIATDAIEQHYHIYGGSLHETARQYARLVRAFAEIADVMAREDEEIDRKFERSRPKDLPALKDGVVSIPHDLAILAEEVLYGMPREAFLPSHIEIEGFTRGWLMQLYRKVEEMGFAKDLPLIERVRMLSEDNEVWQTMLPTHGLRDRVKREIEEKSLTPLADNIRDNPESVRVFYGHPLVRKAQLAQGHNRPTAVKIATKDMGFTYLRRNLVKDHPIVLKPDGEAELESQTISYWLDRRAIEFLGEIGMPDGDEYKTDWFFVDLDPKNNYRLGELKKLANAVVRLFQQHEWVEDVYVHWTGGKGFHIIGTFKGGRLRPVEEVKRVLEDRNMLARLCNDVSVFMKAQPTYTEPYVILDLAPMMRRGLKRNAFSLNAKSGNVAIPVEISRIDEFDPQKEATLDAVLGVLQQMKVIEGMTYEQMLEDFFRYARETYQAPHDAGAGAQATGITEEDASGMSFGGQVPIGPVGVSNTDVAVVIEPNEGMRSQIMRGLAPYGFTSVVGYADMTAAAAGIQEIKAAGNSIGLVVNNTGLDIATIAADIGEAAVVKIPDPRKIQEVLLESSA